MQTSSIHLLNLIKSNVPLAGHTARQRLVRYIELVQQYNETAHLTGFTSVEQLVAELVVDAARLLDLGLLEPGTLVADLGSGNGCPVIPLAVLNPKAQYTAIESNTRKSSFLAIVAANLDLSNLNILAMPVEQHIKALHRPYDCITSRAFMPPLKLFPLAKKLLVPSGEIRGFYGAGIADVEAAAQRCGLQVTQVNPYTVAESTRHVYRAVQAV